MVEDAVGILGLGEELMHLVDVLPYASQVQRAEILVEGVVHQVLPQAGSTLSMLKKKDLGLSLGGELSAMK